MYLLYPCSVVKHRMHEEYRNLDGRPLSDSVPGTSITSAIVEEEDDFIYTCTRVLLIDRITYGI